MQLTNLEIEETFLTKRTAQSCERFKPDKDEKMLHVTGKDMQDWKNQAQQKISQMTKVFSDWTVGAIGYSPKAFYITEFDHLGSVVVLFTKRGNEQSSQPMIGCFDIDQHGYLLDWKLLISSGNPLFAGKTKTEAATVLAKARVQQVGDPDRKFEVILDDLGTNLHVSFRGGKYTDVTYLLYYRSLTVENNIYIVGASNLEYTKYSTEGENRPIVFYEQTSDGGKERLLIQQETESRLANAASELVPCNPVASSSQKGRWIFNPEDLHDSAFDPIRNLIDHAKESGRNLIVCPEFSITSAPVPLVMPQSEVDSVGFFHVGETWLEGECPDGVPANQLTASKMCHHRPVKVGNHSAEDKQSKLFVAIQQLLIDHSQRQIVNPVKHCKLLDSVPQDLLDIYVIPWCVYHHVVYVIEPKYRRFLECTWAQEKTPASGQIVIVPAIWRIPEQTGILIIPDNAQDNIVAEPSLGIES